MNGREHSSVCAASPVLFQAVSKKSLKFYCSNTDDFSKMLPKLNKIGFLPTTQLIDYTMHDFLNAYFTTNTSYLTLSPLHLLAKPLPDYSFSDLSETVSLPEAFVSISDNINCYIEMLSDVLNNKLAQKPYENLRDQENVTEQEHALQAGKIALLLGMRPCDVLALLFHDIARPSVDDALHGYANHCQEGSTILSPLGLTTNYAANHALAKYLLYALCPQYEGLISAVSKYTLSIQEEKLQKQGLELNHLDSKQLAPFLFQIMFMRLIDDMSKVPELKLRKLLGDQKVEYFSHEMIQVMLKNQIYSTLSILTVSENREESVMTMKAKLDAAMLLMLRAKELSYQPDLYDKYHDICAPLLASMNENNGHRPRAV